MQKSLTIINQVTDILNLNRIQEFKREPHNLAYEGCLFLINGGTFRSRLAKVTPKKSGCFAVFWEKDLHGVNRPYQYGSAPDKLIINVVMDDRCGQFVLPKNILLEMGILSSETVQGKMACRFYPPWCSGLNPLAKKIQQKQAEYFLDMTGENINYQNARTLYFGH